MNIENKKILFSAQEKYKNLTVYQGKIIKKQLLGENFHKIESMRIYITITNAHQEKNIILNVMI